MIDMAKHEPAGDAPRRDPAWDQDAYGIDLSLIRENLRRTPSERLRRADAARRTALELRRARRIG